MTMMMTTTTTTMMSLLPLVLAVRQMAGTRRGATRPPFLALAFFPRSLFSCQSAHRRLPLPAKQRRSAPRAEQRGRLACASLAGASSSDCQSRRRHRRTRRTPSPADCLERSLPRAFALSAPSWRRRRPPWSSCRLRAKPKQDVWRLPVVRGRLLPREGRSPSARRATMIFSKDGRRVSVAAHARLEFSRVPRSMTSELRYRYCTVSDWVPVTTIGTL